MSIKSITLERINLELVEGNHASIAEFQTSVTALLHDNTVVPAHFREWKRRGYTPDVLESGIKQQLVSRARRVVTPPTSTLSNPENLEKFQVALRDKVYEKQAEIIESALRYADWCDTFRDIATKHTTT